MKTEEIRKMKDVDLIKQLAVLREQWRDLKFKVHTSEIKNNHMVKVVKKDIARILTVLKER